MIALPQRRQFPTRDDFAAAVVATFQALYQLYESEPVCCMRPDWAERSGVYSVALPLALAHEGGAFHGVSSIVKHAIEMGKSTIGRLARVERDGHWMVFFEVS